MKIFFCKTFLTRLLKRSDIQRPRLCTGISTAWYDQCTNDWRKTGGKKDDDSIPLSEAVFAGQRRWRSGRPPSEKARLVDRFGKYSTPTQATDLYENATIICPRNTAIRRMRLCSVE